MTYLSFIKEEPSSAEMGLTWDLQDSQPHLRSPQPREGGRGEPPRAGGRSPGGRGADWRPPPGGGGGRTRAGTVPPTGIPSRCRPRTGSWCWARCAARTRRSQRPGRRRPAAGTSCRLCRPGARAGDMAVRGPSESTSPAGERVGRSGGTPGAGCGGPREQPGAPAPRTLPVPGSSRRLGCSRRKARTSAGGASMAGRAAAPEAGVHANHVGLRLGAGPGGDPEAHAPRPRPQRRGDGSGRAVAGTAAVRGQCGAGERGGPGVRGGAGRPGGGPAPQTAIAQPAPGTSAGPSWRRHEERPWGSLARR